MKFSNHLNSINTRLWKRAGFIKTGQVLAGWKFSGLFLYLRTGETSRLNRLMNWIKLRKNEWKTKNEIEFEPGSAWWEFRLITTTPKGHNALWSSQKIQTLKYLIRVGSRCLMVSTNQADPGCFYFRISWILMERCWFYFFHPLHFLQGLRSLKHWRLQKLCMKIFDQKFRFLIKK